MYIYIYVHGPVSPVHGPPTPYGMGGYPPDFHPPTTSTGGGIHRHMHIYTYTHTYIHTLYICTYTYYIRIQLTYIYLYMYNLHIHVGSITILGGGPPNAGPYMYLYIIYVKIIDVLCKEKYTFCRFENTKTPVVAAAYVRTSHEPGPPESAETGDWAKELGLANGFSAMLALLMGCHDNPGKDHVQHQSLQTLNPLTLQSKSSASYSILKSPNLQTRCQH